MRESVLSIPQIMSIAGTRVALGVGVGLLFAGKLDRRARRGAGLALLAVGALSTIPLAIDVVSKRQLGEKQRGISEHQAA